MPFASEELVVNLTLPGRQGYQSATVLSDGRFVVSWTDESDPTAVVIRHRLFSAEGAPLTGEILSSATGNARFSSAAAVGTGFVLTWQSAGSGGSDASGTAIRARLFGADGSALGGEFQVNTTTNGGQVSPRVTTLTGGGFVVSWVDSSRDPQDTLAADIYAQVYTPQGVASGPELVVNTTRSGSQGDVSISALSDGGFVVTWNDLSRLTVDTDGFAVRGQRFSSTGTTVGSEFLANTTTVGSQTAAEVHGRPGGGFVVVFAESNTDGTVYGLRLQAFDSSGAKEGGEQLVATFSSAFVGSPDVVVLPNGGYLVVWSANYPTGSDTSGSSIWLREFGANGSAIGDATLVNTSTTDAQLGPEVVLLADGRVLISWEDRSGSGGSGGFAEVVARIYQTQTAGPTGPSEGPDILTGGPGGDIINGLGGDDIITGNGGADTLTGGAGADVFRYLATSDSTAAVQDVITDFVTGTDQIDLTALNPTSISVGRLAGGVSVVFAETPGGAFQAYVSGAVNSNDFIFNGAIGAFIIGSAEADTIVGSSRPDPLLGNDGADTITGGGGADAIAGGAGRDVFRYVSQGDSNQTTGFDNLYDFVTGEDRIDVTLMAPTSISILRTDNGSSFVYAETAAGSFLTTAAGRAINGTDFIYSGGFGIYMVGSGVADTLIGTSLADPIAGGAGNDTIAGGGGADAMFGDAGADTFVYVAASDSTAAATDGIFGFVSGTDRLDLRQVRTGAADTFGIAYLQGGSFLFVDLGGNGSTDMVIGLAGTTLVASDILWAAGAIGEEPGLKDAGPQTLPGADAVDLFGDDMTPDLASLDGRFMLDVNLDLGRGHYHGQDWFV